MESEILMQDNYMDIFDIDEKTVNLYEISRMVDYYQRNPEGMKVADREYMNVYLRAENQSRFYKRVGYDILTYLGDLGGLLDFVLALGFAITSFFSTKLFSAALIGQVYRVQRYARDFS